jgi:hypothetical protein
MAAAKTEQPSCSKSLDELVLRRKISPAISIVNPRVLNLIRLKKRRKYIKIFQRLIAKLQRARIASMNSYQGRLASAQAAE